MCHCIYHKAENRLNCYLSVESCVLWFDSGYNHLGIFNCSRPSVDSYSHPSRYVYDTGLVEGSKVKMKKRAVLLLYHAILAF